MQRRNRKRQNNQDREFEFNDTYVSYIYRAYGMQASAQLISQMRGVVGLPLTVIACAATFAQPIAQLTGYKKTAIVAGISGTALAFIVNPIKTGVNLIGNIVLEPAMQYLWRHSPEWCEESAWAKEGFALVYVAKIEGVSYCAGLVEDYWKERQKRIADQERKAKEDEANRKKQEEENRRKQEEEANKKKQEEENKRKQKEDRKKQEEEENQNKDTEKEDLENEEAPKNEEASQSEEPSVENEVFMGLPKQFRWYARQISDIYKLWLKNYNVYIYDNQFKQQRSLSLLEAVIYFLNGGSLLLKSQKGNEYTFGHFNYNKIRYRHGNPPKWDEISTTEITNPILLGLGITKQLIVNLVGEWIFSKNNQREFSVRQFFIDYFISLTPDKQLPTRMPVRDVTPLVIATTSTPPPPANNNTVPPQPIIRQEPPRMQSAIGRVFNVIEKYTTASLVASFSGKKESAKPVPPPHRVIIASESIEHLHARLTAVKGRVFPVQAEVEQAAPLRFVK